MHAISHVTGGGLAGNLARVMPGSCEVRIDRTTWTPPPVFDLIAGLGKVPEADMEATFNMGVGMVLVLPADTADAGLSLLTRRGVPTWVCGSVAPAGSGTREHVSLFGTYPSS